MGIGRGIFENIGGMGLRTRRGRGGRGGGKIVAIPPLIGTDRRASLCDLQDEIIFLLCFDFSDAAVWKLNGRDFTNLSNKMNPNHSEPTCIL